MAIFKMRFEAERAYTSHEGTILALPVIPPERKAPFQHQYGYLNRGGAMAGHSHATDEIYVVLQGSGYVILGGENRQVRAGDVVAIPHDVWHTMLCTDQDEEPFLWAALWWEPVEGQEAVEGVHVLGFSKETAEPAHEGTILAAPVVPACLKVPFGHAYGYLENGGEMELHKHPTSEVYLFYSGTGTMVIGDERVAVGPGDVVDIPPGELHSVVGTPGVPLLWAALWWDAE